MITDYLKGRELRAQVIAEKGGLAQAIDSGDMPARVDVTLSEAVVLGLLRQGVRKFIGIFGHGSTDLGEVLRVFESAGVVKTFAVRHETEAVHAASALRWVRNEKAAVVTSIGPGAMHALAGSLTSVSNGLGVWFLLGDETTEDEGPNMQQIPREGQGNFHRLFSAMGSTYTLHTPGAVTSALRQGFNTVDHPFRAGPFFMLMPMNTQPQVIPSFNLKALPADPPPSVGAAGDDEAYTRAAEAISKAKHVVVKVGGGARQAGPEVAQFLDLADAVAVTSPLVSGVIPFDHPRNMTVGGSKGSLSGNFAMEEADLLLALGTRFVCQSDCSRTGYPKVQTVVNINADLSAVTHYNQTIALWGDVKATLARLNQILAGESKNTGESEWFQICSAKRKEWDEFRQARYQKPCLNDEGWGGEVLSQPAAIKTASDWARRNDAVVFFDAGDVQANGFQIVEDDRLGRTFTDTGASYMGFASCALLSGAVADEKFFGLTISGDGSFTMNPQILIDGMRHGVKGCILLLDNRRMAAISGLQNAQYSSVYATGDGVAVDYAAWARSVKGVLGLDGGRSVESLKKALDQAYAHDGLSLIHVPVYHGSDPLSGMGVFGRWNVGNWCETTQKMRHDIGL